MLVDNHQAVENAEFALSERHDRGPRGRRSVFLVQSSVIGQRKGIFRDPDWTLFSFNVMSHAFDSDSLLNGTPFHGSSIAAKVVPKGFLFVCFSSIAMVSGDTM